MAIRQSVLGLFNAISDGLAELMDGFDYRDSSRADSISGFDSSSSSDSPYELRIAAQEIVGLSGNAGEIGWFGELLRYFETQRISDGPIRAPELDQIHEDLASDDAAQTLHPTWASRAIAASYVLDRLSDFGVGPARNSPRFLTAVLAASPATGDGAEGTGKVGQADAETLAEQLRSTGRNSAEDFYNELKTMAGVLNPAVATLKLTSRLRKVKREYCAVVTTDVEWPPLDYNKLKKAIEPDNWDLFYDEFFCKMDGLGLNKLGWTKVHEAVSGDCARYRLDTGLKFWKAERSGGLFLNYDMDLENHKTDKLVLVDNGYIWIVPLDPTKPNNGVRVRTSKQLLISGMSATAMAKFAESMGYATNSTDMFFAAVKYPGALKPFTPSVMKGSPKPDTSLTWPVIVPELPPDLRDEFCFDTTKLIKDRLDDAHELGCDFGARWDDGIDLDDFNYLNDKFAAKAKKAVKDAFDTATENFRPKSPTP
jgi:hypothetical protein